MVRSGLIVGAVMLLAGGLLAYLFPLCVPCLALVAGAAAGYLAGQFDRPADNGAAIQGGAIAGAIGGAGALVAHLFGGAMTAATVGPAAPLELARQLGVDLGGSAAGVDPLSYTLGVAVSAGCFGLGEVALMAGLGAVGGILYWQTTGKNRAGAPPATRFGA